MRTPSLLLPLMAAWLADARASGVGVQVLTGRTDRVPGRQHRRRPARPALPGDRVLAAQLLRQEAGRGHHQPRHPGHRPGLGLSHRGRAVFLSSTACCCLGIAGLPELSVNWKPDFVHPRAHPGRGRHRRPSSGSRSRSSSSGSARSGRGSTSTSTSRCRASGSSRRSPRRTTRTTKFASRNAELRDAGVAADTRWNTIFGADVAVRRPRQPSSTGPSAGAMVYRGQMNARRLLAV